MAIISSPVGEARASKFASYFLLKFGESDYIIAQNPNMHNGKTGPMRITNRCPFRQYDGFAAFAVDLDGLFPKGENCF